MSEQSFEQRGEQSRGAAGDSGRNAELDAALERVVVAARKHLAAVKDADGRVDDDAVWRSYVELNNTTFAYDDLMLDTWGEVTPWDVERIEPEEADSQWLGGPLDEAPEEPVITISVRQRRDYEVPSVRALLRVASAVRRSAPSDDTAAGSADADQEITDIGDAVVEILQAGDGALGSLDIPELEPLDSVVTVSVVPEPLDLDSLDDDSPDAGFQSSSDDRLVCRYYEREHDIDVDNLEGGGIAAPAAPTGREGTSG